MAAAGGLTRISSLSTLPSPSVELSVYLAPFISASPKRRVRRIIPSRTENHCTLLSRDRALKLVHHQHGEKHACSYGETGLHGGHAVIRKEVVCAPSLLSS